MKYFVISDVHGEFYKMLNALQRAGFDEDNSNHCLISLGDNFDRGEDSKAIYYYLRGLKNVICLRGNHEDILLRTFARKQLTYTDIYNGVGKTIDSLAGEFNDDSTAIQKAIKKNRGIIKWIKSMPFYLETKTHILTHGWLPSGWLYDESKPALNSFSTKQWNNATWSHTENELMIFRYAKEHNQLASHALDKTLVVGHWHSFRLKETFQDYDINSHLDWYGHLMDPEAFTTYYDDVVPVVGIDGCSNTSCGRVNVYVFEE